ncbi:30S ribosomal protein S9 [Candidatus Woesearchaeota archaeon]|nr:30S ribosomal protein S9 [Candidatus Woesearchaeota archaeon]
MTKVVHVSGRRKKAVARATAKPGKGIIRVNRQLLSNYSTEFNRLKMLEPITIAGDLAKNIDLNINVFGGGIASQTEAIRLVIARALVEITKNKQLKADYLIYDRHLLVADVRKNESSKPNDSKPRAKRQFTKR